MKKIFTLLIITGLIAFMGCEPDQPAAPELNIPQNQLVLSKMVAVGNSLTMGVQSAGISQDFQENSYPYLIAQQMGKAASFEQPLVENPGIGEPIGKTPQYIDPATGDIVQDDINPLLIPDMLLNSQLSRPYDNLGIAGADLNDVLNTTSGSFFDLILRNPPLGPFGNSTMLQQAIALRPTLLLLWVGNNDALGAATSGGDVTQLTSVADFTSRLGEILTTINNNLNVPEPRTAIIMANIPNVNDIPFINTLDSVFVPVPPPLGTGSVSPVLFDENLNPVDFSGGLGLYIPILTDEPNVTHITLLGLAAYQQGIGVPDSTTFVNTLIGAGIPEVLAVGAVEQFSQSVPLTGIALADSFTISSGEEAQIATAVANFNGVIAAAAGTAIPVVDINATLNTLNATGLEGLSGKYVLKAPQNTAFSLDGVHPSNAGYALIANEFIKTINQSFGLTIPLLNVADYMGQYVTKPTLSYKSGISNVNKFFVNKKNR
jgi:lysophospholipase L1-like esterase